MRVRRTGVLLMQGGRGRGKKYTKEGAGTISITESYFRLTFAVVSFNGRRVLEAAIADGVA